MSEEIKERLPESLHRWHELLVQYGAWEDEIYRGVDLTDEAAVRVVADATHEEANRRYELIEEAYFAAPMRDRALYHVRGLWRWMQNRRAEHGRTRTVNRGDG